MFADLVGFTSLSEQLDAEDVAIVQEEYFRAAREVVEARGGQVEKFIGDAVMATFGVHHARDDDSERAVAAGLAVVEAVERIGAALALGPGTLRVRVGVNTGEVVVGRTPGDSGTWRITGDAVNVAARLQTAAAPGSVLVGAGTALAAAHAYAIDPAGGLALKGKRAPVAAWRVLGPLAVRSREAALQGLHAPTLGRERELRHLERSFAEAADGVVGLLVVAPPGVGKTRLVAEFGARVVDAGGTVWTAGAQHGTPTRYDLVAQLLRAALDPVLAEPAPRVALRNRLARIGHVGPRALLSIDHTMALLAGADLDGEPADLWTSWTAVLDADPAASPVWLVEDLHLAGPDQRAFFRHALAEPHRRNRMVLLTTRPDVLWPEGDAGLPILSLEPLAPGDAVLLAESLIGPGVLPPELVAAAAAASGGNPLFVEEVLRSWIQSGHLQRTDAGAWHLTGSVERLEVPSTIRSVYLSQLDDLPDVPRQVVEAGSVPGITFPSRALPVLGVDEPDPALDLLRECGLLAGPHLDPIDSASYTYRHGLLRDTAYGVLPRSSRAQLHVRFAGWVAEARPFDTQAEIIGEHLARAFDEAPALGGALEGGVTRAELRIRAADWLERAGDSSLASAPERAVQLLEHALTLTDDADPAAARRRLRLAEALRRSGRLEQAMQAFALAGEAATRTGDATVHATAALGYEDSLFESRLPRDEWGPAGLRLLSNALEGSLLRDHTRSRLLAALGRAQLYGGQRDLGEATCRLAVEAARRSADGGALAYSLLSLRAAHSAPEHLGVRLEEIGELVEAANRAGDIESELEGVRLQLVDLLEAGDIAAAASARERAEALIDGLRRPLFLWYPAMWRAMTALFRGELDAAERLIEGFREDGRRWHYLDVELVYAVQMVQLHLNRGTPSAALPALRAVAAAAPARFAPTLAACLARAGQLDEAAEQLAFHARHDFTTLPQDLSLAYALAQAVDAAAILDDAAAAGRLRTLLRPWEGHNIVLGSGALCLGAADHFIGVAARVAGDLEGALSHLGAAVRRNDAVSAAPAAAWSRLQLASTLVSAGRSGEARRVVSEGLRLAHRVGMAGAARSFEDLTEEGPNDAAP